MGLFERIPALLGATKLGSDQTGRHEIAWNHWDCQDGDGQILDWEIGSPYRYQRPNAEVKISIWLNDNNFHYYAMKDFTAA